MQRQFTNHAHFLFFYSLNGAPSFFFCHFKTQKGLFHRSWNRLQTCLAHIIITLLFLSVSIFYILSFSLSFFLSFFLSYFSNFILYSQFLSLFASSFLNFFCIVGTLRRALFNHLKPIFQITINYTQYL